MMSFLKKLEDKKRQSLRPGKLKGLPPKNKPYIYILNEWKEKAPLYMALLFYHGACKKEMKKAELIEVKMKHIDNALHEMGVLEENKTLRTHFSYNIKGIDIYTIGAGVDQLVACDTYNSLIDALSGMQNLIFMIQQKNKNRGY